MNTSLSLQLYIFALKIINPRLTPALGQVTGKYSLLAKAITNAWEALSVTCRRCYKMRSCEFRLLGEITLSDFVPASLYNQVVLLSNQTQTVQTILLDI